MKSSWEEEKSTSPRGAKQDPKAFLAAAASDLPTELVLLLLLRAEALETSENCHL